VTLVELVIAILLIGLMATVAGLSMPRDERARLANSLRIDIAATRESAIDSGVAITRLILAGVAPHAVTALPDGSVIADSTLLVDRLSGTVESVGQRSPVRNTHAAHDTSSR
jgi:Tfp pilus assembly protein FimT